jgi:hypothetical protein
LVTSQWVSRGGRRGDGRIAPTGIEPMGNRTTGRAHEAVETNGMLVLAVFPAFPVLDAEGRDRDPRQAGQVHAVDRQHALVQHPPQRVVLLEQDIVVAAPVVVAHEQQQVGTGGGVAQAARELDQEALQEHALALDAGVADRVRRQIAPDRHHARTLRRRDRDELLVERVLAVQVGGEEPRRHRA